MSFNLFGTPTTDDIKVGYVDPTLGYVDGVTICEANDYAKDNPGTTFIFKDGDNNLQYLNINEVNQLTPQDLSPKKDDDCGGIQQYKDCGPPRIQFFGGGGVGATGNPVVGKDGSLLAVDVVSGGHGYQYPPIVAAKDDCQFGNGSVLTAILGQTADQTEVYEGEEDFEEYELCEDTDVGYGRKYSQDGEDLGPWEPDLYTRIGEDPIRREIEIFQKALEKPFWTTRKVQPDRITVLNEEYPTQGSYSVTDSRWGEFMNLYAISPVKPSDTTGTDEAGKIFKIEWEYNFPVSGEYIFRGVCDNIAQVYVDDNLVGDLKSFKDSPSPLQKTIQEGNHTIRVDLLNVPFEENISKTITTTVKSDLKAKFIQKGSSYYLQVDGTGSGKITFVMDVNDSPIIAGLAAKEVWIPSDSGKVKFTRTKGLNSVNAKNQTIGQSTFVAGNYPTEETIKQSGTFTGGRSYGPIQIIGADSAAKGPIPIKGGSNKLALRDAEGNDENIKIIIEKISSSSTSTSETTVNKVISPKSWNENPMGVSMLIEAPLPVPPQEKLPVQEGRCPPNPIWSTRFPTSSQKWYPVNYSGLKKIIETSEAPAESSGTEEVEFTVYGEGGNSSSIIFTFTAVDGQHTFTLRGVSKDKTQRKEKIQIRKNVNYVVNSSGKTSQFEFLEQGLIRNGTKNNEATGSSNKIFADFIGSSNDNDDIQITSSLGKFTSSRKREYNGRSTYDLTYVLNSTPNSTSILTQTEKLVQGLSWSKFMNRYAISPVLPLNTPGSDSAGVTFSNSWEVDLPYAGFYGVKGTKDNNGRLLIDGQEITKLDGFTTNNPKLTKKYLTKGRHVITVEVFNEPIVNTSIIDTKIFSTQDWRVAFSGTGSSNITAKFIQKGSSYYLQVDGTGSGEISFIMDVNDASYIAGLAAKEVRIPSDSGKLKFKRKELGLGSVLNLTAPTEEIIKESGTFTGGKLYGPIEIIGADPAARGPKPIKGSSNKLALRDAEGDDENIKITINNIKQSSTSAPLTTQSPTKNGVTYSGPNIFGFNHSKWSKFMNEYSVSPGSPDIFTSISLPDNRVVGKYSLKWSGVKFPQDGIYKFNFQSDNVATFFVGGTQIYKTTDFVGEKVQYTFNATAGTYDVIVELENFKSDKGGDNDFIFEKNPMGVALYISKDIVLSESNKTPWTDNPMAVSAILIPPPCAKKIGGKGVVEKVIVNDPGNGYLPPQPLGPGYPVTLVLDQVIVEDPGINYRCGEDQIQITPNNGAVLNYSCDSFGRIVDVQVQNPGNGFNVYPEITVPSETGVNVKFRPVFRIIRDPIIQPSEKATLIQVTDLVGLKQTGYIEGRAYYGAIYYDQGIPYAGYYKTAGTQVRVYNTLQESITARVTTRASAIQRSGTDVTSNDPRLNIPGTPESTTQQT